MKSNHKLLNILIFVGLIAGAAVGYFLYLRYHSAELNLTQSEIADKLGWLKATGDIVLIRPLKMLIIPLVFTSVVVGITSIGDPSRLGLLGGSTLVYYFSTMIIAVIIGAVLVTTFQPGALREEPRTLLIDSYTTDAPPNMIENAPTDLGSAWLNIVK